MCVFSVDGRVYECVLMRSGGIIALVAGARVHADGMPSHALLRRVGAVFALWRAGDLSRIVLSGGVVGGPVSEASLMASLLVDAGVPPDLLVLEQDSRTSWENIGFSLPVLASLRPSRIVLVSDLWHLPRLWILLRILGRGTGLRIGFCPAKTEATSFGWWRSAIREIPACLVDGVRAWRAGLTPSCRQDDVLVPDPEGDQSGRERPETDG